MLREFWESLWETAQSTTDQKRAKALDWLKTDGRTQMYEVDGKVAAHVIAPPLRAHKASSVADMVLCADRYGQQGVIWVADDKIILVCQDDDRRETVTTPLVKSATWQAVESLGKPLSQEELIRLLRVQFYGAVHQPELLAAVRHIKFRSAESGESVMKHGDESMGYAVDNEVTGASAIPEHIVLPTVVYLNHEGAAQQEVSIELEVLTKDRKFRLTPRGDDVELARTAALQAIVEEISGAVKIPVLLGAP